MENFVFSKKMYIFAKEKDNDMGNIRTSTQLQEMFQRSRERKQHEKEEQKKQKQLQYKELCKQADELLKKAQEDDRRRKMEELQALAQQTPQKQRKQPYMPQGTPFYNSSLIDDKMFDHITVYTREEIQNMEEKEGGRINWDTWDKLVKKTRQEIKDMGISLQDYNAPTIRRHRNTVITYVYDLQLNLLGEFPTARKAEDAFNIRRNTIAYYKFLNKPYKGLIFKDRPL